MFDFTCWFLGCFRRARTRKAYGCLAWGSGGRGRGRGPSVGNSIVCSLWESWAFLKVNRLSPTRRRCGFYIHCWDRLRNRYACADWFEEAWIIPSIVTRAAMFFCSEICILRGSYPDPWLVPINLFSSHILIIMWRVIDTPICSYIS